MPEAASGLTKRGRSESLSAQRFGDPSRCAPNRRRLFGMATGAVLSCAGALSLRRVAECAGSDRAPRAAAFGDSYIPPAWWDAQPTAVRNFYLSWDQLVWTVEQDPQGVLALRGALRTVVQTSGFEDLKQKIIGFMADSQRVTYCGDLLHALIPGASTAMVHANLFAGLSRLVASVGTIAIDLPSRQALLAYRAMGLASEPAVQQAFELLMQDLGF